MCVRLKDCKNEICGFFFLGTCVSKPDPKSPRMRKVWVYTCMCTTVTCILTCVLHVPSHRRFITMLLKQQEPFLGEAMCIQGWSNSKDQLVTHPISHSNGLVRAWLYKFMAVRFPERTHRQHLKCLLTCKQRENKQVYTGDRNGHFNKQQNKGEK